MNVKILSAACVLLSCQTSIAFAQQPQKKESAWIGFGVGYGSAELFCTGCTTLGRTGGVAALLRFGGTLKPDIRLGGEVNFWNQSADGLWNASVVVYNYFVTTGGGVFLKGGAGFAQYHHSRGSVPGTNGTGPGVLGGLGYDTPVSRSTSFSLVTTLRYGFVGSVDEGVFGSHPRGQLIVDVTLGVLFH
jgi:hypothetical protein